MSSCEEAQQSLTSPQHSTSLPSSMSWSTPRNRSIFFSVLVGMVVVAVVAIACVMVTVTVTTSDSQQTFKQPRQLTINHNDQTRHAVLEIARNRRETIPPSPTPVTQPPQRPVPVQPTLPIDPAPRPITPSIGSDGSCISQATDLNIPAAHIKGHGIRRGNWIQSTEESGLVVPGYQQRWQCNDVYVNSHHQVQEQAFVDGGVWFNQTDKSIYVPQCGYYMIYSQVLFVMNGHSLSEDATVFHNLKIRHNCAWESDAGPIQFQAKSSVVTNELGGVTTTYTANVVHLCPGGNVWIEIPDGPNGVPCCPRGDDSGTFLGLVLLADTPCESWPPVIMMSPHF